jgi:hypothetical protein
MLVTVDIPRLSTVALPGHVYGPRMVTLVRLVLEGYWIRGGHARADVDVHAIGAGWAGHHERTGDLDLDLLPILGMVLPALLVGPCHKAPRGEREATMPAVRAQPLLIHEPVDDTLGHFNALTAVSWFSAATMALACMSALPALMPAALAASSWACVKPVGGGKP